MNTLIIHTIMIQLTAENQQLLQHHHIHMQDGNILVCVSPLTLEAASLDLLSVAFSVNVK